MAAQNNKRPVSSPSSEEKRKKGPGQEKSHLMILAKVQKNIFALYV